MVDSSWLVERLGDRTAAGVAAAIESLIASGELEQGSRLPTVREFAGVADTSIGTVLAAWNLLRERGLIETHRRGGTTVLAAGPAPEAPPFPGWAAVDLAQSAPDITLQPELGEALLASLGDKDLNVFGRDHMTSKLRDAVAPSWPFAPGAWTTAGGGTEALLLATAAAAPRGSLVAVDEPLSPGFLDTLRDLDLTPVAVAADEEGPLPEALAAAIAAGAVAFVFQPGAPFADRYAVTAGRAAELPSVIERSAVGTPFWVVEDDSIGPLAGSEPPSLGAVLPERVIRIRSYCKAFGIDVRTSVIGGARELVDRSIRLRSFGVGSNSRILQNTLAHLVESPAAARSVGVARAAYASRRAALLAALEREGAVARSGEHSLVVWVEVADEATAAVALARAGMYVGLGSKSFASATPVPLLRISVTQLPDDAERVAELAHAVAAAARGGTREFFD
ncbi:GntR family transcriptional regulator [Herbiconiux sp. KACC 21604]|uniref:aminotransferase class I/II-fold pyridoxal phosphate-dependent enzyme n=1 Tax=unclassified Herbiconiux TaxID=2618217 RepID=UPI0014922719|nr:aminotransferase class I/II-fold pyridoxal phosphate-dependent enzyme [Herbiconiux sp. SALV-R1]QJU53900.1 GntR family transcriptional regulator [Herbiconiux sp. SALV-R1]WPO84918.1 GntR family transcriptional regulator [Herbiconiux sp. KACC 21604]